MEEKTIRQKLEELGTLGHLCVLHLFYGSKKQVQIIRLSPDDCYTIRIKAAPFWPAKAETIPEVFHEIMRLWRVYGVID